MAKNGSVKVVMKSRATSQLKSGVQVALKKTAYKMLADKKRQQEIPLASGDLQRVFTQVDVSLLKKGQVLIVSKGPYAKRLYFNPQFNFNQNKNSHAKGEWWEDYVTGKNASKAQQIFTVYYRRAIGDFL